MVGVKYAWPYAKFMNEILALIPARGGSKGIPRKNIRDFAGWDFITLHSNRIEELCCLN